MTATAATSLLADIGGTNARFALHRPGEPDRLIVLKVAAYPSAEDAIEAALRELCPDQPRPEVAVIALAAPPQGDEPVRMTNAAWVFDPPALRARFGFRRVSLVNDFEVVGWALPHLGPQDLMPIGGGRAHPAAPMVVLGPGTGLGVAGYVPHAGGIAVSTEGGHADLPTVNSREDAVLAHLRTRLKRVSAERVLSGPGLVNLHNAVAAIDGVEVPARKPAEITAAALDGTCPVAREALDLFCGFLGGVAGNLALIWGARGGVFLAGGILPRIAARMDASALRLRFEEKGRMRPYLEAIPVHVVVHPRPAFVGLAVLGERGG